MSAMLKINPRVTRLVNYINDVEDGKLQIPLFQRDFVWGKKEKLELFESLRLGYPIGSLLFWKPNERFKIKSEIGPYRTQLPSSNSSDFLYILDGFQRISTLVGCLVNPAKTPLSLIEGDILKEYIIFYDLVNEEFTFSRASSVDVTLIPVNSLIDTYAFLDHVERIRSELSERQTNLMIDRARKLSSAILDYQLPCIEIIGGTIEEAVEIFSRINSKGSKISSDWMVSALTYNENRDFRLGSEIDNLIAELKPYNFEKIKRDTVLQCIQSSFGKVSFDEKLTDLIKKPDFVESTHRTMRSILRAVKFLFEELLVIDIKLLPYASQLIFLSYLFGEVDEPSYELKQKIKQWFWITSYSNYFTIYSLSKQRQAFNQFKDFIEGRAEHPTFNDKPSIPFTVSDFPKTVFLGSVRAKALVLFLLNYANDFNEINAEEVDEFKLTYLFNTLQLPEGAVPLISYLQNFSSQNAVHYKSSDFSIVFRDLAFADFGHKYFLNDSMRRDFRNGQFESVLSARKVAIREEEKRFVEFLGLIYE